MILLKEIPDNFQIKFIPRGFTSIYNTTSSLGVQTLLIREDGTGKDLIIEDGDFDNTGFDNTGVTLIFPSSNSFVREGYTYSFKYYYNGDYLGFKGQFRLQTDLDEVYDDTQKSSINEDADGTVKYVSNDRNVEYVTID